MPGGVLRGSGGGRGGGRHCGGGRLLGQRADFCADPQIVRGTEGMLADPSLSVDQHQARGATHVVALHGVRYRTGRVRVVEADREFEAVFMNERLQQREAVSLMMFERSM